MSEFIYYLFWGIFYGSIWTLIGGFFLFYLIIYSESKLLDKCYIYIPLCVLCGPFGWYTMVMFLKEEGFSVQSLKQCRSEKDEYEEFAE